MGKKYLVLGGKAGTEPFTITRQATAIVTMPDDYDIEKDSENGRFNELRKEFSIQVQEYDFYHHDFFKDWHSIRILSASHISNGCNCSNKRSNEKAGSDRGSSAVSKALESAKGVPYPNIG